MFKFSTLAAVAVVVVSALFVQPSRAETPGAMTPTVFADLVTTYNDLAPKPIRVVSTYVIGEVMDAYADVTGEDREKLERSDFGVALGKVVVLTGRDLRDMKGVYFVDGNFSDTDRIWAVVPAVGSKKPFWNVDRACRILADNGLVPTHRKRKN